MESVMAQSPTNSRASATPSARSQSRSACNRCHQQKLRCIKTREQASCERCARLKTECRPRPRGRRNGPSNPGPGTWVEPRSLAPAIAPAIPDIAALPGGVGCDWLPFLDLGTSDAELGYFDRFPLQASPGTTLAIDPCGPGGFAEPLDIRAPDHRDNEVLGIIPVHQDTINTGEGGHSLSSHNTYESQGYHDSPSRGLGRPLTSTVGRLTTLSMALYDCASKLPSIKISHAESASVVNVPCAMDSSRRRGALFALDEVFRATNEFISVMKNPYSTTGYHELPASLPTSSPLTQMGSTIHPPHITPHILSDQGYTTPDSITQPSTIQGSREPDITSSLKPYPHLDEATMLLFLSCHCQLVEIYKSVFQSMRRCLEGSNATPHSTAGIILPQLQVGGTGGISSPAVRVDFNGPLLPQATISMYMTLITTLSSQLWAQVADALRRRRGRGEDLGVAGPTWGVAMERTDNMERTIEIVKSML